MPSMDDITIVMLQEKVKQLQHAMMTGIGYLMNYRPKMADPKHMLTGTNSLFVNQAAIITLLMDKGVFTEAEYWAMVAHKAEQEVASYETDLSILVGTPVKLV